MSEHFVVTPNTVDEEVDRLRHTFRSRDFYLDNNYVPHLPENLALKTWDHFDENSIKESVIKEYDTKVYKSGVNILNFRLDRVEPIFPKLESLHSAWKFKIFPQYKVKLTKYGVGGSYSLVDNSIRIRMYPNGRFTKSPEQIVVHEIIHIGIEDILVNRYNLTHKEKEYLVELILINLFDEYLPGYVERYSGDIEAHRVDEFDEFVTHLLSKDFPDYIRAYKKCH